MTRALVLKELREHGWVLFALLLLQALLLFGLIIGGFKSDGSVFVSLKTFTVTLGMIGVLVINNRLIVREYTGRTQLFLETLPVSRLRILVVKLLLGLVLAWIPLGLALLACALVATGREPVDARYLAILAARSEMFLFGIHGLAFLAAMLGRYRFVFWAALVGGMMLVAESKTFTASSVPLLRLVDSHMPFERHHFPVTDLLIVAGVSLLCLGAAFALGLTQEGGVAANLARKMSHREKVFFVALAIVIGVTQQTIAERRPRPLFELAQAARAKEGSTFVGIATTGDEADDGAPVDQIGAEIAGDLESLRVWLAMTEMPPVFVVPDSSLDPDMFMRAQLSDTDGVVLKAALAHEALDRKAFRAFAIEEVLTWYSRSRAHREQMWWFASGLAHWWVERSKPDDRLALRSAAAAPGVVTVDSLRAWLTTREKLGPCLADAVGTQLVTLVAEREGEAAFQKLAQEAVGGERPATDVRATLTRRPFEKVLADHGTLRLDSLVDAFNQRQAADRVRFADTLGKLQHLEAELKPVEVGNGSGLEIFHEVRAVPPSAEPVDYTIRYVSLSPWYGPVPMSFIPRFDTRGSGVLPYVFSRGARLFYAFEVHEPLLGCSVRFATERRLLP